MNPFKASQRYNSHCPLEMRLYRWGMKSVTGDSRHCESVCWCFRDDNSADNRLGVSGRSSSWTASPETQDGVGEKNQLKGQAHNIYLLSKPTNKQERDCWIVNRTGEHVIETQSRSAHESSRERDYSDINKQKTNKQTKETLILSGIRYNIVQGFLSLKGLSEAGMPMRKGSFLACSLQ